MFIVSEINNQKFGTFMGNCRKDRIDLNLAAKTESMWTFVLLNKPHFLNEHFDYYMKEDEKVIRQL